MNDPRSDTSAPGSRAAATAIACFVLGTVLYVVLSLDQPFGLGDEGFRYLLSRSWARGDNLFTKYQVLYPTGQYAWFGTLMRLLGEDLWVLRFGRAVLGGACVTILFVLLRGRGPAAIAWALAFAVVVSVPAQAKMLASALVIMTALPLADERPPGPRWLLMSSSLAGALAGWREDGAVLAFTAVLLGVLRRRRPWELVTVAVPGIALGFLPWIGIEGLRGDALSFVAHVGARLRFLVERLALPTPVHWRLPSDMPSSPRELLVVSIPVLVAIPVLCYGLLLLGQYRRWRTQGAVRPSVVTAALVGFAYLPQFIWERPDVRHFQYHLPILLTVLAIAGVHLVSARRRPWLALVLIVFGLTVLIAGAWQGRQKPPTPYPCCGGLRIGVTLNGIPPWAGLDRRPGETLIVLGWSPGWYVVEDLEPGTRFLSTFRRHIATPALEAELIADLRRPENRWVIVNRTFEYPPSVLAVVEERYCRIGRWQNFILWEHCEVSSSVPGSREAS